MNTPLKATHDTAMARTPKDGWDSILDMRRAKQFLDDTGDIVRSGDQREDDLKMYIKALRSFGIRPRTVIVLLRNQLKEKIAAGHLDLPTIAKLTKNFYTFAEDEPGNNSAAGNKVTDDLAFTRNRISGSINASDPQNIKIALMRLGVDLKFDMFQGKVLVEGLAGFGPVLQDDGVRELRFAMQSNWKLFPEKDLIYETLLYCARKNPFNPALEYFDEMQEKWDGKPRLEKFLITYAGATDTPYVRAVGLLPFVAAVTRVREPGAKYDEMLVVESGQGKNKSSAFEIMAVKKEWFTDSFPLNADNRETLEHVQGKIFIECAELQGLRKGDIEHVKALLSRNVDRGRMVWGRLQIEWPRQFVFIGTSNGRNYLRDETGNRRFWPVAVKEFDLDALRRDRDQLWGEAATFAALGESIRLDKSLWKAAGEEQKKRLEIHTDPYTDAFQHYLGDRSGKITAADAWVILGLEDAGRRSPDQNKRFGAALKAAGWQTRSIKVDGNVVRGYVRGEKTNDHGYRRIVVSRGHDRSVTVEYEGDRDELAGEDFE